MFLSTDLAKQIQASHQGNALNIALFCHFEQAVDNSLILLESERLLSKVSLKSSKIAILTTPAIAAQLLTQIQGLTYLCLEKPRNAFPHLLSLFKQHGFRTQYSPGIHATAIIDPSAIIEEGACIAAYACIKAGAVIGKHSIIAESAYVGCNVEIGEQTEIHPHVCIYDSVKIGNRCRIKSHASIGGTGFGYFFDGEKYLGLEHLASVIIEDDVDIGSHTCVDRGVLRSSHIKQGVKLDNLVQIGHNAEIGEHTVIAGQSGTAGQVSIGRYCQIGGRVGISNEIKLGDRIQVVGGSIIKHSHDKPGAFASFSSIPEIPFNIWAKIATLLSNTKTLKAFSSLLKNITASNYDKKGNKTP